MKQSSPNKNLKAFVDSLDASISDLVQITDIPRRTLYNMLEEGHTLKLENLERFNKYFSLDINSLFDEGGFRFVPSTTQERIEKVLGRKISDDEFYNFVRTTAQSSANPGSHSTAHISQVNEDSLSFDPIEFVSVPYYPNVYASGGQGLIAENESNLQILFRRYFFSKTIQASPEGCFVVKLKGDSMQPMFKDGSDLLVDSARTKIKEGPAFMVRIDDDHYCKLLAKLP
ncbi:MAG: S24 family peptidase, partial [Balneola sp.]